MLIPAEIAVAEKALGGSFLRSVWSTR